MYWNYWIQASQIGDLLYSDASPYYIQASQTGYRLHGDTSPYCECYMI